MSEQQYRVNEDSKFIVKADKPDVRPGKSLSEALREQRTHLRIGATLILDEFRGLCEAMENQRDFEEKLLLQRPSIDLFTAYYLDERGNTHTAKIPEVFNFPGKGFMNFMIRWDKPNKGSFFVTLDDTTKLQRARCDLNDYAMIIVPLRKVKTKVVWTEVEEDGDD